MVNRSHDENQQIESIKNVQITAYVLIFTIFGLSLILRKDQFLNMWIIPDSVHFIPIFLCRIALFFLTLFLVLRWIAATAQEFEMWKTWLNTPFISNQVYVAMYGLAIALGLMLVLVYNITIFSGYFAGFLFINYWSQALANNHFKKALEYTEPTEKNEVALNIMENYWLDRPQLGRITIMAFIATITFIISLVNDLTKSDWFSYLRIISYLLLIFNLLLGESIISYWRYQRDKDITEKVYDKQKSKK